MKKITIILLLITAVAISIAGNYFIRKQLAKPKVDSKQTQVQPEQKTEPQPETKSNVKTYTLEEVALHGPANPDYENLDPKNACWMVIHDKVYSIPDSFTEEHPGGHRIYEGCGIDATTLFETRPGGSGTPHSQNARATLDKFYIGDLKK